MPPSNSIPSISSLFLLAATLLHQIPTTTAQALTDTNAQDESGTLGPSSTSVKVSPEGMIILCTIVILVAIIGISFSILFVVARKRQWPVQETIRRSLGQVGNAIKTPLARRFQRSKAMQGSEGGIRDIGQRDDDLEKGSVVSDVHSQPSGNKEGRSKGWRALFSFRWRA